MTPIGGATTSGRWGGRRNKNLLTRIESLQLQGTEVGKNVLAAALTFNLRVPSTARRAGQMAVLLNGDWLR